MSRTCRVQLLELADWTKEQKSYELRKLFRDSLLGAAGGSALVQKPASYRHIFSDTRTEMSTRFVSCLR
jgi:hypothetical protein